MRVVDKLDSYLGLPIPVGKKKSNTFKNIVDRIANRINSWSKRLLSNRGKEIFVKFGGGGERKRGWNMLAWDRLCYPKGMGGFGFRDLWLFNVALLGRQQSIAKAAKVLHEGFGWDVKNDRSINIWTDNWGVEGLSGSSIRIERRRVHKNKVCELFNERKDGWNKNSVLTLYGESMRDQICKLPILYNSHDDQRIWFYNPNGFFSTKSAYSWLILKQVRYGPHRIFWRIIWKLNTLPKIRIFCWRLGHEILPTYKKIASIRSDFNNTCLRCGNDKEKLINAMKDCPKARAMLEFGGFNNKFLGVEEDAKVTWERAASLVQDFQIFKLVEAPMLQRMKVDKEWKKPAPGVVKINFDATILSNQMWFSLVARDNDGFVLGGRMGTVNKEMNVERTEMQAMEESIKFARTNKWDKLELESNYASLVNRFCKKDLDLTTMGHSDRLCKMAEENNWAMDCDVDYPTDIHDLILKDAIN
ncbi:hypothetical protein CXB51_003369 [Gossypium anomalum]|uniref:Reverse transcriptase zinc-binding domain-containing protein n=1 Tax=Gossypium anomalum TaxID=47600 RepID=A0A8J6D7E6_9ROSI|nr:hypothetical protein CXB51_003369 [Gossypium anomalum]